MHGGTSVTAPEGAGADADGSKWDRRAISTVDKAINMHACRRIVKRAGTSALVRITRSNRETEVRETRLLHNALDAIAWSIADTRETMPVLPIGVVMLPPRESSPDFAALDSIRRERSLEYQELGANVLLPEAVEEWAKLSLAPALGNVAVQ